MALRPRSRDRAGASAMREHKRLLRRWRRRRFGGWMRFVYPALFVLLCVAVGLPGRWETFSLATVFGLTIGWWVIRDTPPDHIARWQRGAWGEQLTARHLKPLERRGWVVRHDLVTARGNRDHVLVGHGVYLLDSKNYIDDRLTIEGLSLRVQRLDQPRDSYLLDRIVPSIKNAARRLSAEIAQATGERVWVSPVVVLWASFDARVAEVDGVNFVEGEQIAAWLLECPVVLRGNRRETVEAWLRSWRPAESSRAQRGRKLSVGRSRVLVRGGRYDVPG